MPELGNLASLDAYGSEDVEFVFPFRASDCEAPFLEKVEESIGFHTLQAYHFSFSIHL